VRRIGAIDLSQRRLLDTEPGNIKCRQKYKRQHRGNCQAAHDGISHRSPENGRSDRDHPENSRRCGKKDWAKAVQCRFDHSVPRGAPVRDLRIDLVHQDHRIANDHANEGKNTQDGNKAERLASNKQCGYHPN